MDYDAILQKIEQDKKDKSAVDLYRYQGLMQAIEFFSNRLGFDQIISSSFEFVNEFLTVSQSALFVLTEDRYVLKANKGLKAEIKQIQPSRNLETFAVLCGNVVYGKERLEEYFSTELLECYQVQIMIPLITDATLAGFILLSEKATGPFDSSDLVICGTFMHLFMNALENSRRLEKLQQMNRELDEKIFNLFAINQSSKILLSEHDLNVLYTLSLDVFSELTLSSRTGFFLYDEGSEKFILKAYKNIVPTIFNKESVVFTRNTEVVAEPSKFIINLEKPSEVDYFHRLFEENVQILEPLKPRYIVLLIQDAQVMGFVCLSETVSGIPYKDNIFELVESLASYIYIALSNAMLLNKLNQNRKLLQEKLNRMISLNALMKNVNSAEDLETLQQLIIRTMEVSFGVEKGALTIYQEDTQTLAIVSQTGVPAEGREITLNTHWAKLYKGNIVLETNEDEVPKYVSDTISDLVGEKSGLLAVPIYLEKYETTLYGALLVFRFRNGFLSDEENLVVMEAIANLSAPILRNFMQMEYERKAFVENHKELFRRELKKQIKECGELNTPLIVIHIEREIGLFDDDDIMDRLKKECENVFPVSDQHILIPVIRDFQYYRHKAMEVGDLHKAKVTIYEMGKDFHNYHEFIKRFQ